MVLTRYKRGAICTIAGALYFFSLFMAKESPLFTFLTYPTNQLVGVQGSHVFFALLMGIGAALLYSAKLFTTIIFKFSFVILAIIAAILNFQLLEPSFPGADITPDHKIVIEASGGRLGYIGLRGTDWLFGGESIASKIFFIAALLIVLVIMALYYNIQLPSLHVGGGNNRGIRTQMAERIEERAAQKEERTALKEQRNNGHHLEAKTARSKHPSAANTHNEGGSMPMVGHNDDNKRLINAKDLQKSNAKNTIKSLLKDKIAQAIQKKEDDHTIKQLHISFPKDKPSFGIELLDENPYKDAQIDEEWLLGKAESVKNKLQEFGIDVEIDGCNIGPTVLQIKIKPSAGVKITKIEGFKKDIALALKTKSLRILAPIPGTECVGIEIPNPKPQLVKLRDVMGSVGFTQSMQENRTNLTIGKDISGNYLVKSLEDMPHLLVAGATGSGKSVGVNDFILSLIYQNTPSELKFIMVDPKQVELSIYEGIPYLLSPIITEPQKAIKVLKRTVEEMEKRYTLLKHKSSRNLIEYNEKIDESLRMYRLVVIIDELADLMMSGNKKDTENYITRIAQKARAVGIHLIVATQRPSVDVITGLIKANIPTRIAFGVVSQVDSRTILDMIGAEDLVGKGDLLYMDPKTKYPVRVQGPFVSTAETELIVKAIKAKYMHNLSEQDIYHPEIIRILEAKGETAGGGGDVSDTDEELINQAIEIISETRKASATMLQRKLGIGFPRAARLIDIMEERGIVGPQEGAKARDILI